jgi:hypothetical protein
MSNQPLTPEAEAKYWEANIASSRFLRNHPEFVDSSKACVNLLIKYTKETAPEGTWTLESMEQAYQAHREEFRKFEKPAPVIVEPEPINDDPWANLTLADVARMSGADIKRNSRDIRFKKALTRVQVERNNREVL